MFSKTKDSRRKNSCQVRQNCCLNILSLKEWKHLITEDWFPMNIGFLFLFLRFLLLNNGTRWHSNNKNSKYDHICKAAAMINLLTTLTAYRWFFSAACDVLVLPLLPVNNWSLSSSESISLDLFCSFYCCTNSGLWSQKRGKV